MKEVLELLKKEFHPEVKNIRKLDGYANRNYRFECEGELFILKTYPFEPETLDMIKEETRVLNFLSRSDNFQTSKPIQWKNGELVGLFFLLNQKVIARILTFIDGTFLGDTKPKKSLYTQLGDGLADIDLALSEIKSYPLQAKRTDWNLIYFGDIKKHLPKIQNPSDAKLVRYFFLQFDENTREILHSLPRQLIHGDANEWNILTRDSKYYSLIDFGDCCYAPVICEVAIALTYLIYDKENPLEWTNDFLQAYHQKRPLGAIEVELLYDLIAARLCTSVCKSAESRSLDSENEYARISENFAFATLRKWICLSRDGVTRHFKKGLGMELTKIDSTKNELERRHQFLSKILSVSYKKPLSFTGSAFQYLYTKDGQTVLDAYNNIPHVGHCHPKVVEAGRKQMAKLNTNTRYLYDLLPKYAEKLLSKFPSNLNRVFFVNSGSAASDLAIRLAEKHTGRKNIMVMEHGYHGNTQIGIEVSDYKFSNSKGPGQAAHIFKTPLPDIYLGKYNNPETAGRQYATDAIEEMKSQSEHLGAFIAEPIVGCGGQVPLAPGYLAELYPAFRKQGGVCISDEVQTGFGRIGDHFWGFEAQGVIPDMVILGKPIGNGHPLGAVVCTQEISESFEKGVEFFSSFGGNPVSCAIGLSVLEVIEEEGLQQNAKEVGDHYMKLFRELSEQTDCIGDVRGSGLFIGVEIVKPGTKSPDQELASEIKNRLREENILISTDGPNDNVLKTKPPLCFTKENAEKVVETMAQVLKIDHT
ncbi:aminotransferase class III-fold pyridoxal phosphate-dependent enzyme [Algoriphagus sediminis]|uniref:Aminotransferase class III-fold pyridoxal phosphate-dependent enzyme n=1 Tax=Algoriphagus sediminis TaxID=3057113 RepID=A0ABT7YA29_9BACT|nr:aminotransferase class III-fold pyridoxal phosphate-dependent enzyme [Algoriphagus sediminis]MDN3203280.1 aminotransferase class III-fold pyridoxal phosphate-dependent enzyme [Algoriphagus sediminis]